MKYTDIELKKSAECVTDKEHKFDIEYNINKGRCPSCGCILTPTTRDIQFYRACNVSTVVSLGSSKKFLLITPNSLTRIHFVNSVVTDNTTSVLFYENTTVSSNGSTVPTRNNDRNSIISSELLIYQDPTITDDGDAIIQGRIVLGMLYPSEISPQDEIILKQNTLYQLKLTPLVKDTTLSVEFNWMEVK